MQPIADKNPERPRNAPDFLHYEDRRFCDKPLSQRRIQDPGKTEGNPPKPARRARDIATQTGTLSFIHRVLKILYSLQRELFRRAIG
jgi:hypothetical protein